MKRRFDQVGTLGLGGLFLIYFIAEQYSDPQFEVGLLFSYVLSVTVAGWAYILFGNDRRDDPSTPASRALWAPYAVLQIGGLIAAAYILRQR